MQCVTQRTLQRISAQPSIHLHVPDGRLDGAASFDHGRQGSRHPSALTRSQDLQPFDLRALVALVDDGGLGLLIGQDADLLNGLSQRVAVVRVARHAAAAHHQAFLERGGDADLHAELIGGSRLAFADAFDLGRVQRVQLVFVLGFLRQNAAHAVQQIFGFGFGLLGQFVELAANLAVHATHAGLQGLDHPSHAPVLFGVGVAADLCGHARALPVVVLPQRQTLLVGQLDQMLAALLQQAAVGGMGDSLGHDSRVDDDPVHAGAFDQACGAGGFDGHRQQDFDTFFADALSPACEAGGIDGRLGLQIGLVGEELPIRVLQPSVDHRLVRSIVGVLQVEQAGDQTRGQCGAASGGNEVDREAALDFAPVHQASQAHQGVTHVDQFIKPGDEQRVGLRHYRLWSHLQPRRNLQENECLEFIALQIRCHSTAEFLRQINKLNVFQLGLGTRP